MLDFERFRSDLENIVDKRKANVDSSLPIEDRKTIQDFLNSENDELNQSLDILVRLKDLQDLLSVSALLLDYVKMSDLPAPTDLSPYLKTSDLPAPSDLSPYLKTSDLPAPLDLSPYLKTSDLPAPLDLSPYLKTSDLPAPSDLSPYLKTSDLPAPLDLSPYLKTSDLPAPLDLSPYLKTSDLPAPSDLSPYLKTSDLVSSFPDTGWLPLGLYSADEFTFFDSFTYGCYYRIVGKTVYIRGSAMAKTSVSTVLFNLPPFLVPSHRIYSAVSSDALNEVKYVIARNSTNDIVFYRRSDLTVGSPVFFNFSYILD